MYSVHICIYGKQTAQRLGPNGTLLFNPPRGFFSHRPPNKSMPAAGTHGSINPCIMVFYPVTCPVDCFILVIPSLNLVVSSPYVLYYLYMHILCVFRSTLLRYFSEENPFRVASGT